MDVIMPQLGETVEEGTVSAWRKQEGDSVAVDEVLVEIETDKVSTEVPSLAAGVLRRILVPAGETVKVGTLLAIIESVAGTAPRSPPAVVATPPKAATTPPAATRATPARRPADHGQRLSPAVRRIVAEHDLDVSKLTGTGRDGRVKRIDVLAFVQGRAPAATLTGGATQTIPFSSLRKRIAEHMLRSQATSAHVLQATEVDFTGVEAARRALSAMWKERESTSLTYLPFVARSVALALADFPHLNAHVVGDSLVVHAAINLSLAVNLDGSGLVAPVIKGAGSMSVPALARAISTIAERARNTALKPDDMTEGTYSLTNNGSFGTFITAPVINQPQVAILSIDGVSRRPWVVTDDGGERVAIRPVGVLAQSFDHRVIDGAYSGAYLRRLKEILETREWIGEFVP